MESRFYQEKYFRPYRPYYEPDQTPVQDISPFLKHQYSYNQPQSNASDYYQRNISPPRFYNDEFNQHVQSSPKFENSPPRKKYTPLKKSQDVSPTKNKKTVWQDLYQKGIQLRRKIEQKHREKEQKLDEQCTFKPITRGKSERFIINEQYNFYDRHNIWAENKVIKLVREKQEIAHQVLKECTFSPRINRNSKYYKSKSKKKQNKTKPKKLVVKQAPVEANKKLKFQDAQTKIRRQLRKLEL